jgi:hypothetical protein
LVFDEEGVFDPPSAEALIFVEKSSLHQDILKVFFVGSAGGAKIAIARRNLNLARC